MKNITQQLGEISYFVEGLRASQDTKYVRLLDILEGASPSSIAYHLHKKKVPKHGGRWEWPIYSEELKWVRAILSDYRKRNKK